MTEEQVIGLLAILERSAVAQEKLIELATEEREIGEIGSPPVCPHCSTFAPKIATQAEPAREGSLSEFLVIGECKSCGNMLYGIPDGWTMLRTAEDARAMFERRES